ncbi:cell wall glucanase [Podospora didyma]|uniref:Cell wall glucanase n=1 Tax=Podospora didyma TaxID=330526 RepID=A0AAE0NP70_9PEZI|nr:cell wall glucanase [Podospora didyma]
MKAASLGLALVLLIRAVQAINGKAWSDHHHRRHLDHHRRNISENPQLFGKVLELSNVTRVVVYLDDNGIPVKTATEYYTVPLASADAIRHQQAEDDEHTRKESNESDSSQFPSSSDRVSPNNNAPATLPGITYSPYTSGGLCKTAAQVYSDLQQLSGKYTLIRLYGVDCDQIASVLPAAASINAKLFLGIFELDNLDGQISHLVTAVQASPRGWAAVDTVSVGNELVNNGQATARQVADAVRAVRSSLRSAGYLGPVVTVDTFIAVLQNPVLCDASDYCAMNCHAFFDPNTSADEAGVFVSRQVQNVKEVLADRAMKVVVSESGWPWQGNSNGKAVPGRDNQRAAIDSLQRDYGSVNPGGLIMYNAYDDRWKKAEPGTFYAEQFWGLRGVGAE